MSTTTLSDYKKPPYRRDNSSELDVFSAARYFSEYNDKGSLVGGEEMVIKEGRKQGYLRQGRASLDTPSSKQHPHEHYNKQYNQNYKVAQLDQNQQQQTQQQQQKQQQQQQEIKEKKKYKQPSSPGGKLAHFLNSLFNQAIISSKKKMIPKSTQSMKDEDESPSGRRKRRSSMSHFRSTSSAVNDAKSFYSSSVSGFRTPPPYTINTTTTKTSQNLKTFSDYKEVLANLSKYKALENGQTNAKDGKITATNFNMLDDHKTIKAKNNGFVEISKSCNNHGNYIQEKKSVSKKLDEEVDDDGAESDASSDLFELQIDDFEFGFSSTELPVYETTCVGNIKRPLSTAITNGPIKI